MSRSVLTSRMESQPQPCPFRIPAQPAGLISRALFNVAQPAVERALSFPTLNAIYGRVSRMDRQRPFTCRVLEDLGVTCDVPAEQLAAIPRTGPLVVVANHPFGGLEGIILADLLRRVRPDTRLLANYMLSIVPDLNDVMIYVDPFDTPDSSRRNIAGMRAALRWLRNGGVLGVFPAGEVSHLQWRQRRVLDPQWNDNIARLILRSGADVMPVYFHGRNTALFQMLGLIHPRLRTAMLPRELLKRRQSRVIARVGHVIPHRRLAACGSAQEMTAYLRVRTYLLRGQIEDRDPVGSDPDSLPGRRRAAAARHEQRIIDPLPISPLQQEVRALPAERTLLENGELRVIHAAAAEIPTVLREIGRLREMTFRQVGEGTGKPLDLDRFDEHYLHLFVWNERQRQVVGAYRLGPTDHILPRLGQAGLYTSTLFHFKPQLLEQINPALELGRSFIRPEYQKEYAPLMLLWKGIGHFVARQPRYRMLFGPVSISTKYSSVSRQLLMAFLQFNKYLPDLGRLLRPINPPPQRLRDWDARQTSTVVRTVDEVNELISQIEADRKSMPVLLRQYLKLNAMLLGFNVDPEFGDVLDGLMLVDLTRVDRNILHRYMTRPGATTFLSHHGLPG